MHNKIKVILFINNLHNGGAERALVLIANGLSEDSNMDVAICSLGDNKCKYAISGKVKVFELGCSSNISKIRAIRKIYNYEKPDYCIAFESHLAMKALVANIGLGYKIIVSERTDPRVSGGGRKAYNIIRELLYSRSYHLVFQTDDAVKFFSHKIRNKSSVILNPLNEDLPKPWIGERNKRVVNFCRLDKAKNLRLLIDAFQLFNSKVENEYELDIYGDGPEKEDIKKYIESVEAKNVHLCGSRSNIYEYVRDAMMFVSSSDYEGLSNSMLEAMAMGIPSICTDCPCYGARMVIQNEVNGLIVPVQNEVELSNAMIKIAKDREFAKKIERNATAIREKLNQTKIVEQWKELMR